MDKRIEARVEEAIRDGVFPGCVVGIVRANGKREVYAFGHLTYEPGSPAVTENTVYDVASVTKSIPTASLALMLSAEGKLKLAESVRTFLPELHNDHNATIEDLLRYRVVGPQMSSLAGKTPEEITAHVFENGFASPPGEGRYTNLPAFLLGMVVERVGSSLLDVLAQNYLFGPLGMNRTSFFSGKYGHGVSIFAPTEIIEGEEVRGVVHDESARVFAKAGRVVGHAGLFSTAPDLLNFLESLLAGDFPSIVQGAEKGLGWQTDGIFLGSESPGRFGKTGFTGTSVVCDMKQGSALVILSNRTYPKRPPDQSAINAFRRDIADIIFKNA